MYELAPASLAPASGEPPTCAAPVIVPSPGCAATCTVNPAESFTAHSELLVSFVVPCPAYEPTRRGGAEPVSHGQAAFPHRGANSVGMLPPESVFGAAPVPLEPHPPSRATPRTIAKTDPQDCSFIVPLGAVLLRAHVFRIAPRAAAQPSYADARLGCRPWFAHDR